MTTLSNDDRFWNVLTKVDMFLEDLRDPEGFGFACSDEVKKEALYILRDIDDLQTIYHREEV
jgi:hypothetical protein